MKLTADWHSYACVKECMMTISLQKVKPHKDFTKTNSDNLPWETTFHDSKTSTLKIKELVSFCHLPLH